MSLKGPVTAPSATASNQAVVSALLDDRQRPWDEDAALIYRFLEGEVEAFDVLYTRYYGRVFAIARGILLDVDEAADAVQEVFTLVHRHLGRFDRRAKFSTWLFRIAVNRSIQEARKRKRRLRDVELIEAATREAPSEFVLPIDPRIAATLTQLKPADRAVLLLFYWEELNLREIAEARCTSAHAAKTRLYRARARFKAVYEAEA